MCNICYMRARTVIRTPVPPRSAVSSEPADYRPVPPEPWGRRLGRVRETVAGLTLDDAAALAGHYMLTTGSTISRLESLDVVPTGPRARSRRQLAYVLCRAYRVDPAEFGLDGGDVPPGVTIPDRSTDSPTKWYCAVDGDSSLVLGGSDLRRVA